MLNTQFFDIDIDNLCHPKRTSKRNLPDNYFLKRNNWPTWVSTSAFIGPNDTVILRYDIDENVIATLFMDEKRASPFS
jgi:hypothetical protein